MNKPIELTPEMMDRFVSPVRRGRGPSMMGRGLLGLLLLGAGYWTTTQAIVLYHKGIRAGVQWAIASDIAQTGLQGKKDDRVLYQTAMQLDRCMESLEAVRQSIEPLPLGGPESAK